MVAFRQDGRRPLSFRLKTNRQSLKASVVGSDHGDSTVLTVMPHANIPNIPLRVARSSPAQQKGS
jgi:hypothetical protein